VAASVAICGTASGDLTVAAHDLAVYSRFSETVSKIDDVLVVL
jgi:hypothetical protein